MPAVSAPTGFTQEAFEAFLRSRREPAWLTEPSRPLEPPAPTREPDFRKGDSVRHPAFGEGVVLDSRIVGDDEQVNILFKGHPTPKKLSLSFAQLQRA